MFAGTTIHLRGRVGYAAGIYGKTLPLYERFYVGGINTVRGFEYGKAGPLDINGEPVGGATELVLNAEYIFPIVAEYKLKGLVFFDAGRGYCGSPCPAVFSEEGITFGTNLRYSAGAGIRWISPFGPIRIEWGYNLDRQSGEPASRVDFSFGSAL
jgi:outer membrane protein insertion porin family